MSGLGYYGADGTQESGVNSAAKEKKFTTDFLDELLALGIKRGDLGGSLVYCFLAPYLIGVLGNGEC